MRCEARPSRRGFLIASMAVMGRNVLADDPKPAADVNAAIVKFAKSKLGEQVGDGECTTLVVEAMDEAKAKRFPPWGQDADYVWGTPVEKWGDAKPGDLVQFRDAVFRGKRTVRQDGKTFLQISEATYPHHSAIVVEVAPRTKSLKILQQNVGDDEAKKKTVQEATIRLGELQKGSVKIYRPVALTEDEQR